MKKKILIFTTFLLVFVGGFSACEGKEESVKKTYSTKSGRIDINENEFVIMKMLPENGFIDSSVKSIIENHTKGTLTYGNDFSLEYLNGTNWIPIELDLEFPAIELGLLAGETREGLFNFSLIEKYNNGRNGKYRIVRNFGLYYNFPLGIDSSFDLYMEFEIK